MNRKLQKLAVFGLLVVMLVGVFNIVIAADCGHNNWGAPFYTEEYCTKQGVKRYKCQEAGCDATKEEIINPTGHTEGPWVVSKANTCTTDGEKVVKCVDCEEVLSRLVIPATGHTVNNWSAADPPKATCTEDSVSKGSCSVCLEKQTKIVEKALGHDWGDWEVRKGDEGNCQKEKIETRECKRCKKTETRKAGLGKHVVYENKGYKWFLREPATMNGPGRAVQTCKYCKKVLKSREIKFEGGRYNISVTGFGPRASAINSALFGLNDRLIPVDLTVMEDQVFALVTDDGVLVGEMHVSVMEDTVSVSYQMNDPQTIVSQAVFYMFPDAQSITAADLSDPSRALPFGSTVPLNGQTFAVIAARLVINYNAQNNANRAFPDSGIYLDGATNNATILQEMTMNLMD